MRIVVLLILSSVAAAQGQDSSAPPAAAPAGLAVTLGTELASALLTSDLVQQKLQRVLQFVWLKIRLLGLARSIFSPENLALARQILDYVARVCDYFAQFLPESAPAAGFSFLNVLFPSVTLEASEENDRVNREANFTSEDEEFFERHKDDVMQVAKLIYGTP